MARKESMSESVGKSEAPTIRGSISIPEDQLILLQQKAISKRQSVSKTIEEIIRPVVKELLQAPLMEREMALAQSKARIHLKYQDYDQMYSPHIAGERLYGPHPFMGVNWVLPRDLVRSIVQLAETESIMPEDLMSDMVSTAIPQNNPPSR